MTKKQLETLKNWFRFQVRNADGDSEKLSKTIKYVREMLESMYFTFLIDDHKQIDKIMKELGEAGMDELNKIKEEKTA